MRADRTTAGTAIVRQQSEETGRVMPYPSRVARLFATASHRRPAEEDPRLVRYTRIAPAVHSYWCAPKSDDLQHDRYRYPR